VIVPEPRRHYLHGYPSRQSVAPGERVELHVSTSLAGYSLAVARVGAGEEEVWRRERIAGSEHPVPADAASHGCRWPPALELAVGREWPSGYYRVSMRGEAPDGRPVRGAMAFVVRPSEPGRTASILLQRTTNTDNAYNRYGGSTLYYGPAGPATRVSFERPFAGLEPIGDYLYSVPKELEITADGRTLTEELAGELAERGVDAGRPTFLRPGAVEGCWNLQQAEVTLGLHRQPGRVDVYDSFSAWASCWRNWEHPFVAWAERAGYRIDYAVNGDLEFHPELLDRYRLVLSVGHDEYWDLAQYRTIETAIREGLNVIWLSANDVYMVSPFTPSSTGAPNRIITRLHSYGPLRPEEIERYSEILGPFEGAGPDERNIIGARTVVPFNGSGDWICTAPEHWIFEGTGMAKGDFIPGLVGWEFHGDPDLEREGLEVLAQGTVWTHGVTPGEWAATIFPGPKGNFVFNASTIFWAQGLDSPPGHTVPWTHFTRPLGPDPRVQRITRNLIDRAAAPNPL
jgi:hypothetical protein